MSEKIDTLGDAFPREQQRLRDLIKIYRDLPDGVGTFGAIMIEQVLKEADAAAISGDVVRMLIAFEKMKGCK
jgi:hypothetical protein